MTDAATSLTGARVHGINHVGISVRDLAAARDFWCRVLGFEEFGGFSWPVGTTPADEALGLSGSAAQVALIRAGNMHLELFEFAEPAPTKQSATSVTDPIGRDRAGIAYVAIESRDVRTTLARLESLGINIVGGSEDGWLWVKDPDGNAVAILSGPTRSGRFVDANPPRDESSPTPTPPVFADIAGVDHLGLGLLGSPDVVRDGVRRWSALVGAPGPPGPDDSSPWVVRTNNVDLALRKSNARRTDPSQRRACDLGYNHICLDISGISALRDDLGEDGVRWNHAITESSGGIAAVVYGRSPDGVLVELLENRTNETWMWCGHLAVRD
jgi:catechol 2,3-dioxygenase-like lactoylglutathione lyase family enzyme